MSREEAVNAYIAGRIARRTFIRHLAAAGVSIGAALTYSELLAPQKARAESGRSTRRADHYGDHYADHYGDHYGGSNAGGQTTSQEPPAAPVSGSPRFTG